MAFHSSSMAIDFSIELQLEMLKIQWPTDLLQLPSFAPLHASHPSLQPDSRDHSSLSQIVVLSEATAMMYPKSPQFTRQSGGSAEFSPARVSECSYAKHDVLQPMRTHPITRLAQMMLGQREAEAHVQPMAMEVPWVLDVGACLYQCLPFASLRREL